MAGKTKKEKKKRAKIRKQLVEQERSEDKKLGKKILADQEGDVLNGSGAKVMPEEVRDIEPKMTCPLCGKPSVDGKEHTECMDREAMIADLTPAPEDVIREQEEAVEPAEPFNPQDLIDDILRKHGA